MSVTGTSLGFVDAGDFSIRARAGLDRADETVFDARVSIDIELLDPLGTEPPDNDVTNSQGQPCVCRALVCDQQVGVAGVVSFVEVDPIAQRIGATVPVDHDSEGGAGNQQLLEVLLGECFAVPFAFRNCLHASAPALGNVANGDIVEPFSKIRGSQGAWQ